VCRRTLVLRLSRLRRRRTRQLGVADDALSQMLGVAGPVVLHDGVERLQPLTRLLRVDVLLQHASLSPREAIGRSRVARTAVALRRILPARRPCESGGAGRSHVAEIKRPVLPRASPSRQPG
jgi:hypothetical protein